MVPLSTPNLGKSYQIVTIGITFVSAKIWGQRTAKVSFPVNIGDCLDEAFNTATHHNPREAFLPESIGVAIGADLERRL